VLTLVERLPADIEPLRLSRDVEPGGTKAVMAGYPQDRAYAMTADRDCELRENIAAGRLLLHTCRGMKGYSGAPILVSGGDHELRVAGIQIATIDAGDVWLSDIQVRLDPNRLDLSAAIAEALDSLQLSVVVQLESEQTVAVQ
jgi:V8-like Glu-specific endopeptidase